MTSDAVIRAVACGEGYSCPRTGADQTPRWRESLASTRAGSSPRVNGSWAGPGLPAPSLARRLLHRRPRRYPYAGGLPLTLVLLAALVAAAMKINSRCSRSAAARSPSSSSESGGSRGPTQRKGASRCHHRALVATPRWARFSMNSRSGENAKTLRHKRENIAPQTRNIAPR